MSSLGNFFKDVPQKSYYTCENYSSPIPDLNPYLKIISKTRNRMIRMNQVPTGCFFNSVKFEIRITQSFLEMFKRSKVLLARYTLTFWLIIEPFLCN